MLSYRHGFHAGNFADVLKHSIVSLIIQALKQKDKPFVYIDTHAGAGKYQLQSEFAQKTAEYQQGIARLWQANSIPEAARDYLAVVRAENTAQLLRYPGSPQLVRRLIRNQDRMQLSELHSTDFSSLQQLFAGDKSVSVAKEDGLQTLLKKLPPIQRRGLVLIDPSYEVKADYRKVIDSLIKAHQHFANGCYALWYPVIDRQVTETMLQRLADSGIRRQLRIEHCVKADGAVRGMTGSGMLLINPPWPLEEQANSLLPWLNQLLTDNQGHWQIVWQVPE
jgi:23S rRNA (adenine2030-N6)-methyltransferase